MKRLLTGSILILIFTQSANGQNKFNWADTIFHVGQTRAIQLYRAGDGPCTVKPCYDYYTNKQTYDTLVSFLIRNKKLSVVFLWHTRTIDSDDYNFAISKRMAKGLELELMKQGIAEERISAVGLGEARPLNAEAELQKIQDDKKRNEADRKNQRVELVITSVLRKD